MEIRKASVQDLGQIMQVYDKARKFMGENGNAEQWGEDYPSAELIEHDIDKMYPVSYTHLTLPTTSRV